MERKEECLITVKEIEIYVTAKVEETIKKFKKLAPTIAKVVQQAQENLQKIDTKVLTNKISKAMQFVKKKIENLKKANQNNQIRINISNEEAQKQISQLEKEINSLQKKINARKIKLSLITPRLDEITKKTTEEVTPEGISSGNPGIQKTINNSLTSNKEYTTLLAQENKLIQEIQQYNKELDVAKTNMGQLGAHTSQAGANQNKLTSFFSAFKGKEEQVQSGVETIKNIFSKLPNVTKMISNNIKKMGTGIKNGLSHVLKYAGQLLSLNGIYSVLSNSAQSWLSSQNSGAQQLSANIEYLKYSMGSVFAPIIEYVVNLIYQLMKAIQSVVYAFSGINIFAKATASSMGKTASNANKTSKSLSGIHNDINNVSENSSGGGGSVTTPNIDVSQLDSSMSPLAQKIYEFFKPLVNSWNIYGQGVIDQIKVTTSQIGVLIGSLWGSFENIITNGTIYSILQNILGIIGNIAQAFSNAWNYNGNGDLIIQNLANALDNLLIAINNVVQSEGFQDWLNKCSDKFGQISEKLGTVDWQKLLDALTQIGTTVGTIALDILSKLTDVFKWLVENPIVTEILLAIGIAIGAIATAISIYNTVMGVYNIIMPIATAASTAFGISIGWLIGIIVAIIAVIALIVLAITNWDNIMKALSKTWEWIKQKAIEIFTAIGEFFSNIWQSICDIATNIWNNICNFFKGIWEWIANLASSIWNGIITTISNIINGIKNTIQNVLNTIKTVWNNIWNGVKNTISNIWNGIWGVIKSVINNILSGIESFVNGIIKGINFVLSGISKVANAVGSLIGLDPISLQLNTISLPRLAKGNVAYSETLAIFGEYSGASNNPEITTPQNIMRETFEGVLANKEWGNNNGPIQLSVYVGNEKLGKILLDNLKTIKRQTGQGLEALVGG